MGDLRGSAVKRPTRQKYFGICIFILWFSYNRTKPRPWQSHNKTADLHKWYPNLIDTLKEISDAVVLKNCNNTSMKMKWKTWRKWNSKCCFKACERKIICKKCGRENTVWVITFSDSESTLDFLSVSLDVVESGELIFPKIRTRACPFYHWNLLGTTNARKLSWGKNEMAI